MRLLALMWLISRAELTGSRGRARFYGKPERHDSDYDWSIFTDDQLFMDECRKIAEQVTRDDPDFKIVERGQYGFTLHGKAAGVDVNVKKACIRHVLHYAWALVETGSPSMDAWVAAFRHYGLELPK